MNYANQKNLVRCDHCDALYDKTLRWGLGYYDGTSDNFTTLVTVKEDRCPICNKERK
jgi:hypothetical protein